MGIVKGDKLSESDKLAQCSLLAAGYYTWFMTSEQTDDFGRGRLHPAILWSKVFAKRIEAGRTDVTVARVAGWFREYEEVGLIRVYECDGSTWFEWVKWHPKAPSKRRYHRAPEPPDSSHTHSTLCSQSGSRWSVGGSTWRHTTPLTPFTPITDSPIPSTAEFPHGSPSVSREEPERPTPPDPPAGAGGSRPLTREQRQRHLLAEAIDYANKLEWFPDDRERRQLRSLFKAGRSLDQVRNTITAHVRELRVHAGLLHADAPWPPPEPATSGDFDIPDGLEDEPP